MICPFAFRADWLRANQILPNKTALVRAFGKSMEPTLKAGDMVLVGHRKMHPRCKDVYGMRLNDGTSVMKRSEIAMPSLDLIAYSDTPNEHLWVIRLNKRFDTPLIYKAVWWARTWPQ